MKITKEFYKTLSEELQHCKSIKRSKIKDDVVYAAEQGDFYRENFPFQHATEKLVENEKRIKEIEGILKNSQIIDANSVTINIGSSVTLKDNIGSRKKIQLVNAVEVDPSAGKISDESPLGKLLMGRKLNDTVKLELNGFVKEFMILEIK